jgi:hypothetical protein
MMGVHEVGVRMSRGKRVPFWASTSVNVTVYLVQPVPDMWNVVIGEVRHE